MPETIPTLNTESKYKSPTEEGYQNLLGEHKVSLTFSVKSMTDRVHGAVLSNAEKKIMRSRSDAITLLKTGLGSSEIIGDMTEQGTTSLRSTVANSEKLPESSRASNPDSNTLTSSVNSAPMLSYIISGPDRSVHLRWTNAIPAENDTLRLAIFTKNSIDINKLDGALAFQTYDEIGYERSKYLAVQLYLRLRIEGVRTMKASKTAAETF
ncbi:hypothetical protein HPULCUR_010185 [Helicostylum pulchrum]|uniref:DRBM domain-containing protein n=1 Tax=Helicostylum pulchrum TaxID=562976 RepID=A0ABP9YEH6_9FUNG